MVWRDERGEIAAFNIVHRSGVEGWMGPLAVRPESGQRAREGDRARGHRVAAARAARTVIGLETMPRTMDNIGFYSRARLRAGPSDDHAHARRRARPTRPPSCSAGSARATGRRARASAARSSIGSLPGYDYTREIELTESLALGDTVLLRDARTRSSASRSATPRRSSRGARARSCACSSSCSRDESATSTRCCARCCDYARRSGTRRVAFRVQGEYRRCTARLVAMGARVRWTDLRMTLAGTRSAGTRQGIVLSNWEI